MRRALALLLVVAACLGMRPVAATTRRVTTVHISLRDAGGAPVPIGTATLRLDWWGDGDEVPLRTDARGATLDLDAAWLAARFPNWASMEGARLRLTANGYASTLSEPFALINARGPTGRPVEATTITFGAQSVTVRAGETRDLAVQIRRPIPRRLRFLDQRGRPVIGMTMDIYMFTSRRNHCGVLEDSPLERALTTDAQGRVLVPDGDFDYGVSLDNTDFVVFDDEPVFYQRVITPTGVETTVTLRRFDRQTSTLQVLDDAGPVAGAMVIGLDRYTGCMDPGLRVLGETDVAGALALRDVASERFTDVVICRANTEAWRGSASVLSRLRTSIALERAYRPAAGTPDACAVR